MTFRSYNPLIADSMGGLSGPPTIALQPPYASEYISLPMGGLGDAAPSFQCSPISGAYYIPQEADDWMEAQQSDVLKKKVVNAWRKINAVMEANPTCFFDTPQKIYLKSCITPKCYEVVKSAFQEMAALFPENLRKKIMQNAQAWVLSTTTSATTPATTKPEEPGIPWGWLAGGTVALVVLGVVLYKRKK